eukprot:CAMPEP_0206007796 /NCGR_PEP_ID=MMETSP1464-20131121/6185_1 /ASSEMBLY_ACC=CAM_ASM_001124 /TAXON_ID=119497 /ORGANISM="Exanthemachrysis gayraliae, Strain RCC1523" /LENGTH=145 /DNA_ID=CAMNT_0053381301 /DNA_START=23 /DNA_END=460 /DNA_ORIENTATION=+
MPRKWTEEQDAALTAAVEAITAEEEAKGDKSPFLPDGFCLRQVLWPRVAKRAGRSLTAGACQARWNTALNPNVVLGPWTAEEDAALIESVKRTPLKQMGWSERARELANATGHAAPRRRGGADVCDRYLKALSGPGGSRKRARGG